MLTIGVNPTPPLRNTIGRLSSLSSVNTLRVVKNIQQFWMIGKQHLIEAFCNIGTTVHFQYRNGRFYDLDELYFLHSV